MGTGLLWKFHSSLGYKKGWHSFVFRQSIFALTVTIAFLVPISSAHADTIDEMNDPFERVNRVSFAVNQSLDKMVIRPIAVGYAYIPEPGRVLVTNLFDHWTSPVTLINDLLQGEMARFDTTAKRFMINLTAGIFGVFDVATEMGIEAHSEDMDQTMAVYGAPSGPYIFLPVIGPTTPRHLMGRVLDFNFLPVGYLEDTDGRTAAYGVNAVNTRANLLDDVDNIEKSSSDIYASYRSFYRQNREFEINNGETSFDDLPEIDFFDE